MLAALEHVLILLGQKLVPDLGKKPIPIHDASRPELIELVALFGSFGQVAGNSGSRVGLTGKADASTQAGMMVSSVGTQSSRNYMTRLSTTALVGRWVPMQKEQVRP